MLLSTPPRSSLSFHNSVIDTEDHQQKTLIMPSTQSQLVRQAGLKQGIELRVRS